MKPVIVVAAAFSMSGCIYYGDRGDYDPYYDGYYEPYPAAGFAYSYFGWYDDCYYPGIGTYVYDRYGNRQRWNSRQRQFWEKRRDRHRAKNRVQQPPRENWDGFTKGEDGVYRDRREERVRNDNNELRGERINRRARNRDASGLGRQENQPRQPRSGMRRGSAPVATGTPPSRARTQPPIRAQQAAVKGNRNPAPKAQPRQSSAPKAAPPQRQSRPPRTENRPAPRIMREAPVIRESKQDD